MKLLTTLRSEVLKTKRTPSMYFAIAGALPVPGIFLLNVLTGGGDLRAVRQEGLNAIFQMGGERTGLVFFPMFVILVCTLLPQIEYRNNTWKQVLAAPHTKADVFMAKFLNINLLILAFLLAHLLFLLIGAVITHFVYPSVHVFRQDFDLAGLMVRTGNTYITMLAVSAIQFWLGLRFRNFIVPTAIGFMLWLTGTMTAFEYKSGMVEFFPYSFQTFSFIPELQSHMARAAWTSIAYAALFLFLGFLDFRRRRLAS